MAQARRRKRQRGYVEELKSGALRVKVYAGRDPVSKRDVYLSETVPPGPKAAKQAEEARTRLLNQVDEKRNPRTRASVDQLLDRWLSVIKVDPSTRRGYEGKIRKHIRPLIGRESLTRVDVELLDSLYAELRRCRDHCTGRTQVQHRTPHQHECDEHSGTPCSPPDPESCRACSRACKPHVCRGLSDSTVRQVHWILSGALDRAVAWKWISVNPAEQADKPPVPRPEPRPPTSEEAASLVAAAWVSDADWGAFVWTKMTMGARRGEICALRWSHLQLDKSLITLRRAVYVDEDGRVHEKDTKTHQHRRIVLDPETTAVLLGHRGRALLRAEEGAYEFNPDGFVFSPVPDGNTPLLPDTASQRFKRMADKLGIDTTLKNLRHYSATELISAGVDVRTVAGRLGHGGGGATTLRVYTAWSSEADQRAAATITGRMPARPSGSLDGLVPAEIGAGSVAADSDQPYRRIAADLRGAILSGILGPGDQLPTEKSLADRYAVAASTAHRAVGVLVGEGLVTASRGRRATVQRPSA